jgi:hypothetical protein
MTMEQYTEVSERAREGEREGGREGGRERGRAIVKDRYMYICACKPS